MVRRLWRRLAARRALKASAFWNRPMPLTDLVALNAVIPALKVNGKKQALQELAARRRGFAATASASSSRC